VWAHSADDVGGGGGGGGDGEDDDDDCGITQILSTCLDWTPNYIPLATS